MATSGVVIPDRTEAVTVVDPAQLDHDYGPPVLPKRIKNEELDDMGEPRHNALWATLEDVKPSVMTGDRNVSWLYAVTEDGQVVVGSERPSAVMNEQQFDELVAAMQEKDPAMAAMPGQARDALLKQLDGGGHVSLVVGSAVDGRAIPGKSRVAGELAWSEELQSWIVNDKSGRYMSTRVRLNLEAADAARWLTNVADRFSRHLGVIVRPHPYKEHQGGGLSPVVRGSITLRELLQD